MLTPDRLAEIKVRLDARSRAIFALDTIDEIPIPLGADDELQLWHICATDELEDFDYSAPQDITDLLEDNAFLRGIVDRLDNLLIVHESLAREPTPIPYEDVAKTMGLRVDNADA